jgi:hypothetical protein
MWLSLTKSKKGKIGISLIGGNFGLDSNSDSAQVSVF